MEGSSTRTFPRMLLDKLVELDIGQDTFWIENPANNLSIGGLFICRTDLPLGAPVHIRILSRRDPQSRTSPEGCGHRIHLGFGKES